tara:strand:- start:382 stop:1371 length:990 start_codon:yes stop_codon:yes gene_type:complete
MTIERVSLSGEITETKTAERNGVPVGIVAGYMASWQLDSWNGIYGMPDRIVKGSYTESIQEHKANRNRQVRLKDNHGKTIGGFPIESVREDNRGLYGIGEINLDTQQGREAYSLAQQNVLVDFSVGHVVTEDDIEDGTRLIKKAILLEASITDEPKNQRANITEVKTVFGDLPLYITDGYVWDESAARDRVMEMKFSIGNGSHAFIGDNLIGDVIGDKLYAVPSAIRSVAALINGTEEKNQQVIIERYYAKMGEKSPFKNQMFYSVDDVKDWSNADLKSALLDTGMFSNGAVRALIATHRNQNVSDDDEGLSSLLEKIVETTKSINKEV